jgi:hypothetical protein
MSGQKARLLRVRATNLPGSDILDAFLYEVGFAALDFLERSRDIASESAGDGVTDPEAALTRDPWDADLVSSTG